MGTTGQKVKGRYSFVYTLEDGEWKILHHHSSVMPETILTPSMTDEEKSIRSLFDEWNDALATLDSEKVAQLYASDPIFLPAGPEEPRTDFAGIQEYFDTFLKLKPHAKILEGKITLGDNWAQDAGVYEMTIAATGDTVQIRYSFLYVLEDGKWKIAHHHNE